MIRPGQDMAVAMTTHACANGETVECRLTIGGRATGRSVYVNGASTSPEEALARLLASAIRGARPKRREPWPPSVAANEQGDH
jgi:hypothetical protein